MPRWMPDGESILFVRLEPDAEGFLHPRPLSVDSGRRRRPADHPRGRPARSRSAPAAVPSTAWAVAVRQPPWLLAARAGGSDERGDRARSRRRPSRRSTTGRASPRTAGGSPSPATARGSGGWRSGTWSPARRPSLAPPADGTVASPAWSPDGRTVYAVVGDRGFIDLWAFPADGGGTPAPLTRTQGAALAPAPSPDGKGLFYLSLEPDGLDLRRLDLPRGTAARRRRSCPASWPRSIRPAAPERAGAVRHAPRCRRAAPTASAGRSCCPSWAAAAPRRAALWSWACAAATSSAGSTGWSSARCRGAAWPEGGALAAAWRGWPVEVGFHLFQASEEPADQTDPSATGSARLDLDRRGAELSAGWDRQWSGGALRLTGRTLQARVDADQLGALDQDIASLAGSWAGTASVGPWRLAACGPAAGYEIGERPAATPGPATARGLRLGLGHDDTRLSLSWQRDGLHGRRPRLRPLPARRRGTSLLPETALAGRIAVPALPAGTWLGEEHEGQRAELALGFLPAPLFFERHRLWSRGESRATGCPWPGWSGPGLARSPADRPGARPRPPRRRRAQSSTIRSEVFEDETRWWLVTVWRP